MNPPEEFRVWFTNLLQHPLVSQIAPFIVLFLFPLVALVCKRLSSGTTSLIMVLESLGSFFPWSWGGSQSNTVSSHETKKLRKKHVRARGEQLEMNGYARQGALNPQPSGVASNLPVWNRHQTRTVRRLLSRSRQHLRYILLHELHNPGQPIALDSPSYHFSLLISGNGFSILPPALPSRCSRQSRVVGCPLTSHRRPSRFTTRSVRRLLKGVFPLETIFSRIKCPSEFVSLNSATRDHRGSGEPFSWKTQLPLLFS